SHDLKTPLAAVLGAAGTPRDLSSALSDGEKTDLLATGVDEAGRLNRFLAHLLDMTRPETGADVPNPPPPPISESPRTGLAPRQQDFGAPPGGARPRRRPAHARCRCSPLRASLVQLAG